MPVEFIWPTPIPDSLDDRMLTATSDYYKRPEKFARDQVKLQPDVDPNDIRMAMDLMPLEPAPLAAWLAEEPAG